MNDKKLLKDYYKKKMYNNRGKLGRAVDFAVLRLVMVFALYLWFRYEFNTSLAIVLSVIGMVIASIVLEMLKAARYEKFLRNEHERMQKAHTLQSLLIANRNVFISIAFLCLGGTHVKEEIFSIQKLAPIDQDDVARAYRAAKKRGLNAIHLFSTAKPNDTATALAMRIRDVRIHLHKPAELIKQAEKFGFMHDIDTIEAELRELIKENKAKRKTRRIPAFSSERTRNYILITIALLVLSFIARSSLYYRLMAGICSTFAMLSWWTDKTLGEKDKTGDG